jgi:hypothetical protein
MRRFVDKDWWTTTNGTFIGQEREFDPLSGILSIRSTLRPARGRTIVRAQRIRLYTATRLAELLRDAGLLVIEAFDAWSSKALTRRSTEMLLVARKEA